MPPYTKTIWNAGAPPGVSAPKLNNMEQGIADALPKDGSEPMTGKLVGNSGFSVIGYDMPNSTTPTADLTVAGVPANSFYVGQVGNKTGYPHTFGTLYGVSNSGVNWAYSFQLFFSDQFNGLKYRRALSSTSWSAWESVWHSGNDGAGSGLDADMLGSFYPKFAPDGNSVAIRQADGHLRATAFHAEGTEGNDAGRYYVGDDAVIEDFNTSNAIRIRGIQNPSTADIFCGTNNYKVWHTRDLAINGGVLQYNDGGIWKAAGGIKNVQRGIFTLPQDGTTTAFNITIASVNMAKTFLNVNYVYESGASASSHPMRYRLTTATNIEIFRGSGMYDPTNGAYEVIEFY